MTDNHADKPVNSDADLRPPVLPMLLELDRVTDALRSLLPDFDVDRITRIELTPRDCYVQWSPAPGSPQTSAVVPVLNAASLAELNGKAPE